MGGNDSDLGAYCSRLFLWHPGISAQTAEKIILKIEWLSLARKPLLSGLFSCFIEGWRLKLANFRCSGSRKLALLQGDYCHDLQKRPLRTRHLHPVHCPCSAAGRLGHCPSGNAWLAIHPTSRPKDYWSVFKTDLANGFGSLCAYTAMHEPVGTIDHYLSCDNHRDQAYEWSNYRYASAWVNSSKGAEDDKVLDPFLVEDGWFEIILPSLQQVMTDAVPEQEKERAKYTLTRLHLRDDERVIRQRQVWYQMYQAEQLNLDGLEKLAPLIARAVRKQQAAV